MNRGKGLRTEPERKNLVLARGGAGTSGHKRGAKLWHLDPQKIATLGKPFGQKRKLMRKGESNPSMGGETEKGRGRSKRNKSKRTLPT